MLRLRGLLSSAYHCDERRAQGVLAQEGANAERVSKEGAARMPMRGDARWMARRARFLWPQLAAAAGRLQKNAFSFLHEMLGSPSSFLLAALLLPLELGFFFIAVAPGVRPAPARRLPGLPCKA